ncbi:eCIS core domain-containing protein [Ideonella sp. YS5]|uniref:eCIS core domain-containing protein n=1 Tax=Ideonella sp. YS5 TaxID=3453714 RepID=UPI003EEAA83A
MSTRALQPPARGTATPSRSGLLQRRCACGTGSTLFGGNCPECGKKRRPAVQAKLRVGRHDDPLEREADQTAERVLRGDRAAPAISRAGPAVQRDGPTPDAPPKSPEPAPEGKTDADQPAGTTATVATCDPQGHKRADYLKQPGTSTNDFGLTRLDASAATLPEVTTKPVKGGVPIQPTSAALPKIPSVFTAADTFFEGEAHFIGGDGRSVCASGKKPIRWTITAKGADKIREGELDHCSDFQLAFDLSLKRYADAVNALAGKRSFASQAAAEKAVTRAVGVAPGDWLGKFACLARKSLIRDRMKWHEPRPMTREPRAEDDCKFVRAFVTESSLPEVGQAKHPSSEIIKDCGEAGAKPAPAGKVGAPALDDASWDPWGDGETEDTLMQRREDPAAAGEPTEAPALVDQVLGSPGRPLDEATRAFMEPRFGHDFGDVRVHVDAQAARSARSVDALAYTVDHHVVFGHGAYDPGSEAGQRLLAHELTHVVQQGVGRAGGTVQRDVIDDVRHKLSYRFTDWAITDAEARASLALLGKIPADKLEGEIKRLGAKYVGRLLDNLPDQDKKGDVYQRVIAAIGPAGLMPHATEQLDYGLFDWAITDAEVARVFNLFATLPESRREEFLHQLHAAKRLGRLIDNAPGSQLQRHIRPWIASLTRGALTGRQKAILRDIVDDLPGSAIDLLTLAAETRFDLTVGPTTDPGRTPAAWDAGKLRQTYLTLDKLPDAHTAHNAQLLRLGQFSQKPTALDANRQAIVAGSYQGGLQELSVNREEIKPQPGSAAAPPVSNLPGTLIHETGHAVDQQLGFSTGPEAAKPERGGWKSYGRPPLDCAHDMVEDSNGAIKTALAPQQRSDVETQIAATLQRPNADTLVDNIGRLPWFAGLPKPTQKRVRNDRALPAVGIGMNSPWFLADGGGEHLGDHVYQRSYPGEWVRYRHEARSRRVSDYQFRAPGEWFAEAYATYYAPDSRGQGAKLADKDANTKRYFDAEVDTLAPSR